MMIKPTRFNKIGATVNEVGPINSQDSYLKTFEFPIVIDASTSPRQSLVKAPRICQPVSAYIRITNGESVGITPTVSIGVVGLGAESVIAAVDVSTAGAVGSAVTDVIFNNSEEYFSYTLGSSDFANLEATCVVTVIASDV